MKYLIVFLFVSCSLLTSTPSLATVYYVDCGQSDPAEDGSFAHPWNSLADIRAHRNSPGFSPGDDIYFRAGEANKCTDTSITTLSHGGTDTDPAVLGCYDGWNDFECDDYAYLDGGWSDWSNEGTSMFRIAGDWFTIQDIKFQNIAGACIARGQFPSFAASRHLTARRNYFHGCGGAAVSDFASAESHSNDYFIAEYNIAARLGLHAMEAHLGYPAALYTRGDHSRIRYNLVYDVWAEGVNCHHLTEDCILEYNLIANAMSGGVYMNGKGDLNGKGRNIARYNLVVCDSTSDFRDNHSAGRSWSQGIGISSETAEDMDGAEIYGNVVVGCYYGIQIANWDWETNALNDINIYNNLFIDNHHGNFRLGTAFNTWNVRIKNNVSVRYQTGQGSGDDLCEEIWTWGTPDASRATWDVGPNHFTGNPPNGNYGDWGSCLLNHADNTYGDPLLVRTAGWQQLAHFTSITTQDTFPTAGSPFIDQGVVLAGYGSLLKATPATDFFNLPTAVTLAVGDQGNFGGGPEMGAYIWDPLCVESWTCTDWVWSTCLDDQQTGTRTCTDANGCGTALNKPDESQARACGTETDAGVSPGPDAGGDPDPPRQGCGCTASCTGPNLLLLLAAFVLLGFLLLLGRATARRRRRRW